MRTLIAGFLYMLDTVIFLCTLTLVRTHMGSNYTVNIIRNDKE